MTADRPATEPHNFTTPDGRTHCRCGLAEAAQGAAPLDKPCKVCEGWGAYCDEHKPEGAAPRAEGLDVRSVLDRLVAANEGLTLNGIEDEYARLDTQR